MSGYRDQDPNFKPPFRTYIVPEVAKIMRMNQRTVLNHIRAGKIKATKVGRKWLVAQQAIDEFFGLPTA